MIGSRNKPLRRLSLWLTAASVCMAGQTMAAGTPAPAPEPQPPAQEDRPTPGPRSLAPAAGDRGGAGVDVVDLEAIDPAAVGTLTGANGGLAAKSWKTLTRAELSSRIQALPAMERSPVMRDLTRRALLSATSGPKDAGTTPDGAPSWLAARVAALSQRGLWEDAAALAERAPAADGAAAQAGIAALLQGAADEAACARLETIQNPGGDPFWAELRIFCYLVNGDAAAAQLALDVLKETRAPDAFVAAAGAALGGPKPVKMTPRTTAEIAMWRRADLPPPPAILENESAGAGLWAETASSNALTRLGGLGLLARYGLRPESDFVTEALTGDAIGPQQKDDPEEAAKKLALSAGDAVFVRSIRARTVPAAKASAFAAMLQRGQSRGEFPYVARVLAGEATTIPPLPETAWAAPEVTRVLIYNGQVSRAESWLTALNANSPSDQPTFYAVRVHGAIMQPSADPARAANLDKALQSVVKAAASPGPNQAQAKARMTREFPILAALGTVIPPDGLWAVDANSPGLAMEIGDPALLEGMARAAEEGAAGAAVLNAALLLKGQGAAAARSQTVAAIVKSLMRLGLRKEAKALALEALLGAGMRN